MSETFKPARRGQRRSGLPNSSRGSQMRRVLPVLIAAASFLPAGLAAQPAAPAAPGEPAPQGKASAAAVGERMAPFAWLIGEWRGSGWTFLPDGSRHRFESRETVTPKLSGNAILVEGRHYQEGKPEQIVHDAMAMITWDSRTKSYRFRSALANGMGGDFAIEPNANGFTWRIDTPSGPIVYVVTHENGVWTERGSRTGADGKSVPFFEMTLRRE